MGQHDVALPEASWIGPADGNLDVMEDQGMPVITPEHLADVVRRYPGWKSAKGQLYVKTPDLHWGQVFVDQEPNHPESINLWAGSSSPSLAALQGRKPSTRPSLGRAYFLHALVVDQYGLIVDGASSGNVVPYVLSPTRSFVRLTERDVLPWLDHFFDVVVPVVGELLDDQAILGWNWDGNGRAHAPPRTGNMLKRAALFAHLTGDSARLPAVITLLQEVPDPDGTALSMEEAEPLTWTFSRLLRWLTEGQEPASQGGGSERPDTGRHVEPATHPDPEVLASFVESPAGKDLLLEFMADYAGDSHIYTDAPLDDDGEGPLEWPTWPAVLEMFFTRSLPLFGDTYADLVAAAQSGNPDWNDLAQRFSATL